MAGNSRYRILIVDDEVNLRQGLIDAIESPEFQVDSVDCGEAAIQRLRRQAYHVVVTDLRMPGALDGYDVLKEAKGRDADSHVIMITAYGTIDGAVEAMKMGAYDFITKPIDIKHFRVLIQKAIGNVGLILENRELKKRLRVRETLCEIVSHSATMKRVMETVMQVSPTSATVLIQGESGTGKEVVARAIHENGNNRGKPFITVNCGALPETLFESEMFGHEAGSFTGAIHQKKGVFELSHGGTLLLDEVTEISEKNQVDLLRAIQEGEITRVGGVKTIKVDARIIATTNKHIPKLVAERAFREDLFYRLNVIPLVIPPLRERKEDIPVLTETFLRDFALIHAAPTKTFSPDAMNVLADYPWPGNIRQLRNVVERLVLTSRGEKIDVGDLPLEIAAPERPQTYRLTDNVKRLEREIIQRALAESGNRREKAAQLLGISLRNLHYKLRQHGLY
ncbi:MAG: hypothetical protein A2Z34_00225 [Planctomycetes bacterium RBG_16_59_8]|nr:MAG: hypothetical protein A2Z34_00225 [Planctomycetes bacterium RBG_16_59_8]